MIILDDKIIQHVPKTAGISLTRSLAKECPQNIRYSTNHKPLKFKDIIADGKYKDFPVYSLVREPVSWYKSWWNYTSRFKINCAITQILHEETGRIDMPAFISYSQNLTEFFKEGDRLKRFKYYLIVLGQSHLHYFFDDITEITADDFKNRSVYDFYLSEQLSDNTINYKFENLNNFLEVIGLKPENLLRENITRYKKNLDDDSISIIKSNNRIAFDYYKKAL